MTASSEPRTEAAGNPEDKHPLRGSSFRYFWLARTVSGLGSAISSVALPVLVYQLTGEPILVSLVAAANTLPFVIFGLLAGAWADRVDRRRLMVLTDWLSAATIGSVAVASMFDVLSPAHIVLAALASASLTVFFEAGSYGLVPAVVGKANIASANSALYTSATVVRIVGTAVAGGLISLIHSSGALATDALSFLASALLVRAVAYSAAPAPAGQRRPTFRESIVEGLRFLLGQPTLRVMTVVGTLQSFSGGAIVGQLVVFADRGLGLPSGDSRVGLLYTAWAVGGIAGTLLLPRVSRRIDPVRLLLLLLPVGAALSLAVVFTTVWWLALITITAWGSAYLMVLVNTMNYSQHVTPPHLQSRVNTTRRMLSSGLGVPLGALVASTVTTGYGIRSGMAMAVLSVSVATVLVWVLRLIGHLSAEPDEPAAP